MAGRIYFAGDSPTKSADDEFHFNSDGGPAQRSAFWLSGEQPYSVGALGSHQPTDSRSDFLGWTVTRSFKKRRRGKAEDSGIDASDRRPGISDRIHSSGRTRLH